MNTRLKKINAEYEKNAEKMAELQARQDELDKERRELENLDIVGLVRSMGLTPDALAALIRESRDRPVAPTENKEESDHETL